MSVLTREAGLAQLLFDRCSSQLGIFAGIAIDERTERGCGMLWRLASCGSRLEMQHGRGKGRGMATQCLEWRSSLLMFLERRRDPGRADTTVSGRVNGARSQ